MVVSLPSLLSLDCSANATVRPGGWEARADSLLGEKAGRGRGRERGYGVRDGVGWMRGSWFLPLPLLFSSVAYEQSPLCQPMREERFQPNSPVSPSRTYYNYYS